MSDAPRTLSHLDASGQAAMVDVTGKASTRRRAVAQGALRCSPEAYRLLTEGDNPKGDVEQVARIAGIAAGKRAGELIPLCHLLPAASVKVDATPDPSLPGLRVRAVATIAGQTGVEMEALTAVAVALLAAYDMLKAADRGMTIESVELVEKSGGRSGAWQRDEADHPAPTSHRLMDDPRTDGGDVRRPTPRETVKHATIEVLCALYEATDGPNWDDNTNWLTDAPLGEWHGVSTDHRGRVISLQLTSNGLVGEISSELGSLAKLRSLFLSDNELAGTIPAELGNLAKLEILYLSSNELTGEIPAALGNLAKLETLSLFNNELTGTIPAALGDLAKLKELDLSSNELTGEIPAALGNLAKLKELDLSDNELTGEVPAELGNLTNLEDLDLSDNELEDEDFWI